MIARISVSKIRDYLKTSNYRVSKMVHRIQMDENQDRAIAFIC